MIKLRNLMAGFGAGLIVASVTLQLTSSSGGSRELAESATGAVQLDENNVKKWAEENGYQLIKKEEKAASALHPSPSPAANPAVNPAADPAASPSANPTASPSISPAASPGAKLSSNNAAKPAADTPAAPSAAAASTPSAAPVSSPASTQPPVQTPEVSPPASPSEPKSVTIPGGASSTQVGEILADAGIVDKAAFDEALRQAQASTRIRSGTYSFMPGEDPQNIIDELTKVPKFQ